MICGGMEVVIILLSYVGFVLVWVLFFCNDDFFYVSCFFDKDWDGFVMGEGLGILILEELEFVLVWGVKIYGEMVGYVMICDVYYIIVLVLDGWGVIRAIVWVLKDSGLKLEMVSYINVYGISIFVNDVMEICVIKQVLGNYVYNIVVSFIKFMIGYLLGGFGGIEVVVIVMAIVEDKVFFIINLENFDFECDLDYVLGQSWVLIVDVVLFNFFGFGGYNVILVFKKY